MTVNLFLSSTFFLIRFEIVLTISYTSRRVLPDTRNPEGQAQRIFYMIKRYPGRSLYGIITGPQSHLNMKHYIVPLVALYYASSATLCSFAFHESSIYPAISLATRSNLGLSRNGPPGARFSKVPNFFRARKAIRKTPTRLFGKAALFICCKGNNNENNCKVSCLETPSFCRYKENDVTRNEPEKFRDF